MRNMDSPLSLPIRIVYRPPQKLLYFSIFNHAGAMLCVSISAPGVVIKLTLACLLLLHFIHVYRAMNLARDISQAPVLCLRQDDSWVLIDNGREIELRPCPGALVHRLLLVICFSCEGKGKFRFVLCRDNVDETILRRLRVRLLHGKAAYATKTA